MSRYDGQSLRQASFFPGSSEDPFLTPNINKLLIRDHKAQRDMMQQTSRCSTSEVAHEQVPIAKLHPATLAHVRHSGEEVHRIIQLVVSTLMAVESRLGGE